ncbi:metallophosphoesterase [Niabella sp. W65]|nr:metallophosphoesterase [Niabella sp. W65]MCH7364055.1 metallophosphoesterase [Niabella sp. W65]
MKTFVMGDLHGAYKALDQCLLRCGFDPVNDTLIQLGDVCDGHSEVYECVEVLINISNLVAIKGNHDVWFQEFLETDFHPVYWIYGGVGTIRSYLNHAGKPGMFRSSGSGYKTALESSNIPQAHKDFFAAQRLYYIDDQSRCFVHGGFKNELAFDKQREQDFYWNRNLWEAAITKSLSQPDDCGNERYITIPEFKEIYLGHTPTLRWGLNQPLNAFNIWNLDTGAGSSGRLTIMDVDTKEYWQSDPLNELYPEKV